MRQAGVEVKVLTGDNDLVTKKSAGMWVWNQERMVTGAELSSSPPQSFLETVLEADIFVKLSPAQKEQIVRDLRSNGHVVGFMGDGINDAPALKAADVGISVDSGG